MWHRHKASKCCWKKGADRLVWHRVATNLQFVNQQINKTQSSAKHNKENHKKNKVCLYGKRWTRPMLQNIAKRHYIWFKYLGRYNLFIRRLVDKIQLSWEDSICWAVKIPAGFFVDIDRPIPKFLWKVKISRTAITTLKKKNKVENDQDQLLSHRNKDSMGLASRKITAQDTESSNRHKHVWITSFLFRYKDNWTENSEPFDKGCWNNWKLAS